MKLLHQFHEIHHPEMGRQKGHMLPKMVRPDRIRILRRVRHSVVREYPVTGTKCPAAAVQKSSTRQGHAPFNGPLQTPLKRPAKTHGAIPSYCSRPKRVPLDKQSTCGFGKEHSCHVILNAFTTSDFHVVFVQLHGERSPVTISPQRPQRRA